ncbi:hypothetical protein HJC23_009113 [Cyclotella cryptica]|uniref:NFACT RNA-binding domain-containing protein n=1 Tax=Cyclotella cryptica TaxID=29204 RepID=A0ABD3R3D1_9STRA|eukprot:CCRYP_000750-RA/>CCRYP_000750-RA protein AED:0.17 eAED:-0.09 QI:0/0/0/1/1/1/2/0/415
MITKTANKTLLLLLVASLSILQTSTTEIMMGMNTPCTSSSSISRTMHRLQFHLKTMHRIPNHAAFVRSFGSTRPLPTFQPVVAASSSHHINSSYRRKRELLFYQSTAPQRRRLAMTMSFTDDSSSNDDDERKGTIDLPQIKKSITRLVLRTHKKIGKVSTRMDAARQDQSTSEQYVLELEQELSDLQSRLRRLNWLEDQWNNNPPLKKKTVLTSWQELIALLPENETGRKIMQYIQELEIDESEVARNKRIEEDMKNKKSKKEMVLQRQQQQQQTQGEGARLPYRRYYSENQTEIRVGKQATDNDVLSLSPQHRSPSHWWYHASGCPGSHVILCTDASSPSEDDVRDAASLAALKSKCINQSVIKVSMTRARNVSKPPGAKAGLVMLNGDVRTIVLRKDEVERRCERLEKTVLVN